MRLFRRRAPQPTVKATSQPEPRDATIPASLDVLALDPLVLDPVVVIKTTAIDSTHEAASVLRETLQRLHPSNLAGVSHRVRTGMKQWVRTFDELDPRQARRLTKRHPDSVAAAIALSMHRNGHIRELSVHALRDANDPLVVPFLLLRSGEWVDAVRQEAVAALDPWIHVDHTAVLVRSYPLLHGARFALDRPAGQLPDRIEQVLRSPAARPALLASIGQDRVTSRTAVRIAAAQRPTIDLLERALSTDDVVSAAVVARALPTEGPLNQQTGELLWQHPTARLRQEGVYRLLKHDGNPAQVIATEAMKDRSESVRSTAQRWFAKRDVDVAGLYRLLPDADRLAALLGLGDHPDEQDAPFARSSLDTSPATRRAALRLLARLGLRGDEDVFVEAFMSGTPREQRTAIGWFRRAGVTPELLEAMWFRKADEADDHHGRVQLLTHLAPMTSVWNQLELALLAVNSQEQATQWTGVGVLYRIAHQSSGFRSRPHGEQLMRLRSAFEAARPKLDVNVDERWSRSDLAHRIDQLLHE